jgi:citrate synthase
LLAPHDPELTDTSREASLRKAERLIARVSTLVAAWEQIRNGKEPLSPLPENSIAANFLYMLKGEAPTEEVAGFFDAGLVLHAEHSFNASTFAAREVASTRAHMYAAIGAAVGSLSGELHGGANVRVMEMLQQIDAIDAIDAYIQSTLDAGKLIFGLGHAIYQVDDPRALILAPMSKKMGELTGQTKWYDISIELEKRAKAAFKEHKGIDIFLNVDFYSASLFYGMGIPTDLFSPVFAISRMAGWTAHVMEEQYADAAPKPVLYRPESDYIGDYCGPETCTFTDIEDR